jgi:hypothetical protein
MIRESDEERVTKGGDRENAANHREKTLLSGCTYKILRIAHLAIRYERPCGSIKKNGTFIQSASPTDRPSLPACPYAPVKRFTGFISREASFFSADTALGISLVKKAQGERPVLLSLPPVICGRMHGSFNV